MNGLELLQKVRSDPALDKIPFLFVTTEARQRNVIDAVEGGANNLIVKPFDMSLLKAKIEAIFGRENKWQDLTTRSLAIDFSSLVRFRQSPCVLSLCARKKASGTSGYRRKFEIVIDGAFSNSHAMTCNVCAKAMCEDAYRLEVPSRSSDRKFSARNQRAYCRSCGEFHRSYRGDDDQSHPSSLTRF